MSSLNLCGCCVAQSFSLFSVFCRYCLSFDLNLLIIPVLSSNLSCLQRDTSAKTKDSFIELEMITYYMMQLKTLYSTKSPLVDPKIKTRHKS